MDEAAALRVIAARAIETSDAARDAWTDEDRAWASRAAAEVVGADAPPEAFLARRADLVLERIGGAHPGIPRALRALRWRPWVAGLLAGAAFVLGFFVDQVDRTQRINVLAPPVLLLLAWNLAVYAVMLAGYIVHYGEGERDGVLRALVSRLLGGRAPRRAGAGPLRGAVASLAGDWAARSAPLQQARAARILHICAASLAAGVLAGLYLRGLALEYLASWQSTFLDASTVRRIVAVAYAPGAWATSGAVPGVEALEAMRAPAGVNAAPWIHLMAASVAMVVIVPRLALALAARLREGWLARRLLPALDEPYFQRVLRGFTGGTQRVRIVPFSTTLDALALDGLEAIVARAFAPNATLIVAPAVRYGDEAAALANVPAGTVTLAVFDAAATPEREVHGAFLSALRAADPALVALVDEGAWRERWHGEPSRVTEREANWQRLGEETGVPIVFVELASPDLAAVEQSVDAALGRAGAAA